jgi:hypothetical protein
MCDKMPHPAMAGTLALAAGAEIAKVMVFAGTNASVS